MPTNPFGALGSKGDTQSIDAQTRAVRAYEQARARLISSMKGEERAIAGVAASHAALMRARSTDDLTHERGLQKTSKLLAEQGKSLKDLDVIRERYHREEMTRSQSLLQRYEGIKKALKEIQEDTNDTSTLIGSFMEPYKAGVANMKKFGDMATISARPVGDLTINMGAAGASMRLTAEAIKASGRNMVDMIPTVFSLGQNVVELDKKLQQLTTEYNLSDGAAKKLALSFIDLARVDLTLPGAVKGVAAVTAALEYLQVQGVATDTAMAAIVENTRSTGRSFEESAQSLEAVSEAANLLRTSLDSTNTGLKGFTLTMRDDFVRAVAEATRNIDSQVVSIENVASAYRFAAENAMKYGASVKGVENVAKTFTGILTREGDGPARYLTGKVLATRENRARAVAEKDNKSLRGSHGEETEEFKTAVNRAVAQAMGLGIGVGAEHTARRSMEMAASGGGSGATYNVLAGTQQAQEEYMRQIQALLKPVANNAFAQTDILAHMEGFSSLSQIQQQDMRELLLNSDPTKAADQMAEYQREATEQAARDKGERKGALSAAVAIVDPINKLFSIEALMKSQLLTMDNVFKTIENIRNGLSHIPILRNFMGSAQASNNTGAASAFRESAEQDTKRLEALYAERKVVNYKGKRDAERSDARTHSTDATTANAARTAEIEEAIAVALRSREESYRGVAQLEGRNWRPAPATLVPSTSPEAGRRAGGISMAARERIAEEARAEVARNLAAAVPLPGTSRQNAAQGQLSAGGVGNIHVDTAGRTVIKMDLLVNNLGAAVDEHLSSNTAYANKFGPNR